MSEASLNSPVGKFSVESLQVVSNRLETLLAKASVTDTDLDWVREADDLAAELVAERRYDEAAELFGKSYAIQKRTMGPFHEQSLTCLSNWVESLMLGRQYEPAIDRAETCYQSRLQALGRANHDTLKSLRDTALLKNLDDAATQLREGLNLSESTHGSDDPTTLRLISSLASVLKAKGEDVEAEALFQRIHGPDFQLWQPEARSAYDPRPFFVIGITGHMNIPDGSETLLKERIRSVIQWLQKNRFPNTDADFGPPLDLEKTPIILLTSLAPGADQLAAEVALEENIRIRCPLPFPHRLYRRASTFANRTAAGTIAKQDRYDELLEKIGPENTFLVTHTDDSRDYIPYLEEQLDSKEFRNRRYRAAGEYVAANADLLIAICDQEEAIEDPDVNPELSSIAQCGSRIIISSYINGIEAGILPLPPTLSYQENGPVIRIYCPNTRKPRRSENEIGDVAIWHPADSVEAGKLHEQIHEKEMDELRLIADRLEKLNQDLDRCPKIEFDPQEMFKAEPPYRPQNSWDRFEKVGKLFDWAGFWKERLKRLAAFLPWIGVDEKERPLPPLKRLVSFKSRVEYAISRYDRQVAFLTNAPFFMGFFVFLIYEIHGALEHFDIPFKTEWAVLSFLLGGLLLAAGIWFHTWAKSWGAFNRKNDYRALIEATRVQFYWVAAGIPEMVSAHYMQRVSGEISWIKSALDSLMIPIERATQDFRALPGHRERLARFRNIWKGWICDEESFFSHDTHFYSRLHHSLQLWGNIFLSASAFMIFITFAHGWLEGRPVYHIFETIFHHLTYYGIFIWIAVAFAIWLTHQWVVSRAFAALYDRKEPDGFVRTLDFWQKADNKYTRILAGLTLGLVLYSAIHELITPHAAEGTAIGEAVKGYVKPNALHESVVDFVRNTLFTLGGLFLGYSVVKFTGENSRRYEAMRGQFGSAKKKIARLMDRYEELINRDEAEQDMMTKIELEKEMNRMQRSIQDLFIILGREALHENTEWLLMRRNRPVEPIAR